MLQRGSAIPVSAALRKMRIHRQELRQEFLEAEEETFTSTPD